MRTMSKMRRRMRERENEAPEDIVEEVVMGFELRN